MRFTKINNKSFSLTKRSKNSFWVKYEIITPSGYYHHFEYDMSNISWRRFKKLVLELY